MRAKATLYHNPSCSKSRSALGILSDFNEGRPAAEQVLFDVVEYLQTPPDAATIESILRMLPPDEQSSTLLNPLRIVRTGNAEFTALHLDQLDPTNAVDRQQLLEAMVSHPSLIERPIFVKDDRAVIGRPPERVLDLLH
ncbi:arsenate reductase (glutaredoxin) [Aphanomyces invadans]|nr:arsenate reductase (glutaredoxin) [Aphanomyces invadans]ETV91560.1 arsenate reductase (glutaredoxin) [Aphanomyces invadans]|eukprot:XP_008879828.1 arsenate reductase (glutaredoxin) [Aphanomyces invadans]